MNSYSLKKGFSWKHVLLGIVTLVVLLGSGRYAIVKFRQSSDRNTALAQSKAVAEGLLSFKMDQGSFPCQATRKLLEDDGIDFLPSGTSANAYLAQLVATDNIDSEQIFTLPGLFPPKMGDCRPLTIRLLEPGENSFAYIMAPDEKPLTNSKNNTPIILVAIAEEGQNEPIFNHRIYGNKFVMGLVDGSATLGDLDENGHALSPGGTSLFQTGADSLFGKDTPVVKYPLFPK